MNHSAATFHITEQLFEEFGRQSSFSYRFDRCLPDAIIKKPNGKLLVVEIGYTDAAKISKYLKCPDVDEIRWYSKDLVKVATWIKGDTFQNNRKSTPEELRAKLASDIKSLRRTRTKRLRTVLELAHPFEMEAIKFIFGHIGIVCPICHERFYYKKHGLTSDRKIIVCPNCNRLKLDKDCTKANLISNLSKK